MKLYSDKDLLDEITVLDLGIVEAGDVKEYIFYVQNDTDAYLKEIEFTVDHQEVDVVEAPFELSGRAVAELKIKWTPSITLKEGLRTPLRIRYKEQWG